MLWIWPFQQLTLWRNGTGAVFTSVWQMRKPGPRNRKLLFLKFAYLWSKPLNLISYTFHSRSGYLSITPHWPSCTVLSPVSSGVRDQEPLSERSWSHWTAQQRTRDTPLTWLICLPCIQAPSGAKIAFISTNQHPLSPHKVIFCL